MLTYAQPLLFINTPHQGGTIGESAFTHQNPTQATADINLDIVYSMDLTNV